ERRAVGPREQDSLVAARVQRPAPAESPDSPASVLADGAIRDGLGGADLRQRDPRLVEEAEPDDDGIRLDARRLMQGQECGQEQQDRADDDVDPRRKPLLLLAQRRTVHRFSAVFTVAPRSAGDFTTMPPAASSAFIFSAAVPLPPAMMAPACPMRRPGGAVCPAMKATTGLRKPPAIQHAASSSAIPPISPIRITASVPASSLNALRQSMKFVPLTGSPPIPITVDWPSPRRVSWSTASYVRVPEREMTPTVPGWWMRPGMIPILHSPGVMMPGQ